MAERRRLGLDIRAVAKLAGYTRRINKGISRIERFEREGVGNPEFVERLFSCIGLSLIEVQQQIVLESQAREERKVATWLRQNRGVAVAERLTIRCFSGVYSSVGLPLWIDTPAEAVAWSRSFAKRRGVCVCLPLSPHLFLFINPAGQIEWLMDKGS